VGAWVCGCGGRARWGVAGRGAAWLCGRGGRARWRGAGRAPAGVCAWGGRARRGLLVVVCVFDRRVGAGGCSGNSCQSLLRPDGGRCGSAPFAWLADWPAMIAAASGSSSITRPARAPPVPRLGGWRRAGRAGAQTARALMFGEPIPAATSCKSHRLVATARRSSRYPAVAWHDLSWAGVGGTSPGQVVAASWAGVARSVVSRVGLGVSARLSGRC
jgi:hypothetical protein